MKSAALPKPESLPPSEIEQRLRAVQQRAASAGLGSVLAFADCWRTANVRYFTDF